VQDNGLHKKPVCCACAAVDPDRACGRELRLISDKTTMRNLIKAVETLEWDTDDVSLITPPSTDDIHSFRSYIENTLGTTVVRTVSEYESPFHSRDESEGHLEGRCYVEEDELVAAVVDVLILGSDGDRDKLLDGFPDDKISAHFKKVFSEDDGKETASETTVRAANEVAHRLINDGIGTGTAYPQFNLRAEYYVEERVSKWVLNDQLSGDGARFACDTGLTTPARSVLVMVGGPRRRTPWHIDWTSAVNVGFAIKRADAPRGWDQRSPIATWYFVHPCKIDIVDDWLYATYKKKRLSCGVDELKKLPHLTHDAWTTLADTVNSGCHTDTVHAFVVEQKSGEAVVFPPGWLHYVETHVASVKFAWDVYDLNVMDQYVVVWRDLIARFTAAEDLPEDYARVGDFVVKYLCDVASKSKWT
jgi:hypothetical protein